MVFRVFGVALFAVFTLGAAHAQAALPGAAPRTPVTARDYTPEYDRCVARAGRNTVQVGVCAQAELTRQDARLNQTYIRLMNWYPSSDRRRYELRAQENRWLKERDTVCKVNGTTVDNNCLLDQTIQRTAVLEALSDKHHSEAAKEARRLLTPPANTPNAGTPPGQH